jgi:hypothetical protein
MAVAIRGYLDRGMAEPALHHLQRQFEATIDAPVDAPRRVEVAQSVQSHILRLARLGSNISRDLDGVQPALEEIVMLIRFGLLALIFFLCTPAHSETGNGLLQACEALEREARLEGDNNRVATET